MMSKTALTERLLYIFLVIMFVLNLMALGFLINASKSATERRNLIAHNQSTLLCIIRESTDSSHTKINIVNGEVKYIVDNSYIDKCVKDNN